jgi:hypothetical protein
VRRDIHVDLAALQAMLLEESTVVLRRHREAVTLQTPRAQPAVLKGAIRVVSHLRQELGRLEFFREEYSSTIASYQKRLQGEIGMIRSEFSSFKFN